MKKQVFIVKLGIDRATPVMLVDLGRNHVTMLTDNGAFPSPKPSLADLTKACNDLDAANQAFMFNRGKLEKDARDERYLELKAMIRELGAYVQQESQGARDLILSAGFDVRRASAPVGPLPAPQDVRALVTPYPGRIDVRWKAVRGRSVYEVSVCTGNPEVPANWSLLAITSKNRYTADGLESDKVYFFRVVALGAAGASPVSDPAMAKAA